MKQLFTILLTALVLTSCSKETSFERSCGTITAIHVAQRQIILDGTTPVSVSMAELIVLKTGDQYCR